ncbi:MAG TPA: hypothetical protein PKL83_00655 [bacterium]|nr:hypothetical protein [bacterium]
MGLIDFLKKIGVLKVGSQSWKGDAANRPVDVDDELQISPSETTDTGSADSDK